MNCVLRTGMSQELQSASRSPKRTNRLNSSPKVNRPKTQDKPMFPFEPKGRKKLMSQFKAVRGKECSLHQPFSIQVFS